MELIAASIVSDMRRSDRRDFSKRLAMGLILLIVILLLVFGGGGGYYAHRSYGLPGLGGVLGFILLILILAWFFGGLGSLRV
jgi:uncharacterized membrane protein YkvI